MRNFARRRATVLGGLMFGVGLGVGTVPLHAAVSPKPVLPKPVLPKPQAPAGLLRALQGSGLPLSSFGVYVQPVDGTREIAAINAEEPYVLASTAKLVTALAALDMLGPRWRWRTHSFVTGPIVAGRLKGDLMIVGGGDARLTSAELQLWMQRMRNQGLKDIDGDILLDHSAFLLSEFDHRHTPVPAADRPRHVWPDALMLDEGVMQVLVKSARGPRQISRVAPPGADYVGQAVARLWQQSGGSLQGQVRQIDLTGGNPKRERWPQVGGEGELMPPWSTHLSEPLPAILREMNKSSNNLTARHLMLSLARGFPLRAASLGNAQASVQAWLKRQGLAEADIALDNGSGLSRTERGKPRALVHLLLTAWRSKESRSFVESLPVAGVDGTLQGRMLHGAATGRAYLKTGSLLDARALAGYVTAGSGTVYAVAALVNHPQAAKATGSLDAMIEWLAKNG
jgi:serine-type D-Ala-D-Ala carboxypeptidase/endopeptidase (penicillin-binding protein 4)